MKLISLPENRVHPPPFYSPGHHLLLLLLFILSYQSNQSSSSSHASSSQVSDFTNILLSRDNNKSPDKINTPLVKVARTAVPHLNRVAAARSAARNAAAARAAAAGLQPHSLFISP